MSVLRDCSSVYDVFVMEAHLLCDGSSDLVLVIECRVQ